MAGAPQLRGRWRLVSWTVVDDGQVAYPFGTRPEGVLVLLPDAWAAVQIAATDRPAMSGPDPFAAPEAERARAFTRYLAYTARYEVRGDSLILTVQTSLYPQWSGSTQLRHFRFFDGELVLRTPPVELDGRRSAHELRWRRES